MTKNWQNWVVGDVAAACIPLGDQTAEEHGLPDSVMVVRARTAEEACRKGITAYNNGVKKKLKRLPKD